MHPSPIQNLTWKYESTAAIFQEYDSWHRNINCAVNFLLPKNQITLLILGGAALRDISEKYVKTEF